MIPQLYGMVLNLVVHPICAFQTESCSSHFRVPVPISGHLMVSVVCIISIFC